jgi:succinate dehydrogenase / fumarate reductase, cytochrome b subunit
MNIKKLNYVVETKNNWHVGMVSFVAQRITGLALVFYLIMHVISLSSILAGADQFKGMMESYNTPLFHVAEWLLLACVLFHMFNGLRVMFADWFGITRLQRGMFWVVAIATAAVCLASIPFFFMWR